MLNFRQVREDELKQELLKLFTAVKLPAYASVKEKAELAATLSLLETKSIPGKTPAEKLAQACYTAVDTFDQIPSLFTNYNINLLNEFARNIGLASSLSYRRSK